MHLQTGEQFQLLNMFSSGVLQRPLRNHIPLNFFAPTADLLCAFAPESAANLLVPPQLAPCCSLLLSLLVSCLVLLLVSLLVSPELGGCHDDFPLSLCLSSCLLLALLAGAYASSWLFGVDGGVYSHGKTARPFGMPRKEYAKCAFFELNALCPKSEADAPNDFERLRCFLRNVDTKSPPIIGAVS